MKKGTNGSYLYKKYSKEMEMKKKSDLSINYVYLRNYPLITVLDH